MSNAPDARLRIRKARQSLDEFDLLPREIKQIIWEAPTRIVCKSRDMPASVMRRWYETQYLPEFARDTERVYGPSHPQSAAYQRGAKLSLADLGL